jgi:acetolactate synthase I/II/III large subunit
MSWRYVAASLAASGVRTVFGLPGDGGDLFEALASYPEIRAVAARDQRNAAFMAWGAGLTAGQPGVCAVSGGPGLTNTLTALLEVASASAPLVMLVASSHLTWRQRGGFQALDHAAAARPFTKWQFTLTDPAQLPWALRRAFHVSMNGQPGPVLLEIPEGLPAPDARPVETLLTPALRMQADPVGVERAAQLCLGARRPAMLLGGGARRSGAGPALLKLADQLSAPIVVTASGRGVVDESTTGILGVAGIYLFEEAARLLAEADLLLVWGSKLEETATLSWSLPEPGISVVQVDIDPGVVGNAYPEATGLVGDCSLVACQFLGALQGQTQPDRSEWSDRIQGVRRHLTDEVAAWLSGTGDDRIEAPLVAPVLAEVFGPGLILAQENGLLDIWGFHYPLLTLPPGGRVIAPAEQTAMGCSAAAALGASLATGQPVACITGDGAFQFLLADLATAVSHKMAVTYVVLENGGYGWVRYRQGQSGSGPAGSAFAVTPDLEGLGSALGIPVFRPRTKSDLRESLQAALEQNRNGSPALVGVTIECDQIPPGVLRAYGPPGPAARG